MQNLRIVILIIGLFFIQNLKAQYKTVLFDDDKLNFNQGEPLPADQYFILKGYVNPDIDLVRFYIQKAGISRHNDDPILFENFWKRSKNNKSALFELPVNYALKGNTRYDFFFEHYALIDSTKFETLRNTIFSEVETYIENNLSKSETRLRLKNSHKEFISELEKIIDKNTEGLKNKVEYNFTGFSLELKTKLKKLSRSSAKGEKAQEDYDFIKELIKRDVERFINPDLVKLESNNKIGRYPIEKTANIIAFNVGYGGAISKTFKNFADSSSPFIGISVPFSSRQYSSPIVKNTSISFGLSLKNFIDKDDNKVTGPIIRRPLYAALGYKFFRVLRLNGGMLLTSVVEDGNATPLGNMQILPFVGLSLELNVWMGVGKRKKLRKN